jgi:hypothetical protein
VTSGEAPLRQSELRRVRHSKKRTPERLYSGVRTLMPIVPNSIQDQAFVVGLLETQNAPKRMAPTKSSAAHAASMFSFEALSTA